MPPYFSAILDGFSDEKTFLIATKRNNSYYLEKFDLLSFQSSIIMNSGENYYARLNLQDELVFYKDKHLYWGERVVDMSLNPPIDGIVIPVGNSLIFQSKDGIFTYDGDLYSLVKDKVLGTRKQLIDAHSIDKLMFVTKPKENSGIAELH